MMFSYGVSHLALSLVKIGVKVQGACPTRIHYTRFHRNHGKHH